MKPYALIPMMICLAAPAGAEQIDVTDLQHLPDAQVFVFGEFHDSEQQHLNQAAAVAALGPKAMVFEMLTPAQVAALEGVDRTDIAAFAKATDWENSGWPDLSLYWPVFQAAPTAALYGGNVPSAELRAAFKDGAAAVFGAGAGAYGLDQPLPDAQQAEREQEQFDAHCEAMPLEMMGGMVAAQRIRDARLAEAALRALRDTGGPVAVITGNGHARTDWGMPALLRLAAPDVAVLSVGQLEETPDQAPPYDLWLVTEPTDRGDPCEGFGKTQ
ncbi:ChaN family lipoprotein [Donghicola sp. C2-DW-16]|uniref:ChaN family lipoprotein n=1 Tax=Donghicola mangrovi TaxID=2729614 RepID=A0ABX2PBU2_9RHOB|nr:ChaN family lipoprotein [Donghicola mangrovi]NVO26630.1 ChaN family lipoprotein [Donghicola mangrovi]